MDKGKAQGHFWRKVKDKKKRKEQHMAGGHETENKGDFLHKDHKKDSLLHTDGDHEKFDSMLMDHKKSHFQHMSEDNKHIEILHKDHNKSDFLHMAGADEKDSFLHKDHNTAGFRHITGDHPTDDVLQMDKDIKNGLLQESEAWKKDDFFQVVKGEEKNDWGSSSTSKQIQNIVLVGRTGNGKSATGNSLVGKKVFKSKAHASGVTMECKKERVVTRDDQIINIIDTPGLFDLSVSSGFLSKEIIRCFALAEGGIHAVLLVLSARNRITSEEESTLCTLQNLFGSKILDYAIVVFTGGDALEDDGETLEDYLSDDCPDFLKEVLMVCNRRMVLFDNMTHDDAKKAEQVDKLFSLVNGIQMQKGGEPFTDEIHHKIEEENERRRQQNEELDSKGLSEEMTADMKNQLQTSYEETLSRLSEMLEKKLKPIANTNERPIRGNQRMRMGGDQKPFDETCEHQSPKFMCSFL